MTRSLIAIFSVTLILLSTTMMNQEVYGDGDQPETLTWSLGAQKAIPDWVKNQFDWYLKGEIDEKTLLTSMNWMFDNNIMFLSEHAATEVKELKMRVSHLEDLLGTSPEQYTVDSESGTIRFGDGQHGSIPSSDGVRGWDYTDKETILGSGEAESSPPYVPGMVSTTINNIAIIDIPSTSGVSYKILIVDGEAMDINSLVQAVIRESYMETNEDLQYYADKVRYYNDLKNAMREENQMSKELLAHELTHSIQQESASGGTDPDELGRIKVQFPWMSVDSDFANEIVGDILRKGGTASAWEDGVAAFSEHGLRESVNPELQGIVVLCNIEIDKKVQSINAELEMLESWLEIISEKQQNSSYDASSRLTSDTATESGAQNYDSDLDFITRNLSIINGQIKALDTGIMILDEKLSSAGYDAQLANIDLQNSLQKIQQKLDSMSTESKMLHDTAMAVIRKIG